MIEYSDLPLCMTKTLVLLPRGGELRWLYNIFVKALELFRTRNSCISCTPFTRAKNWHGNKIK